MPKGLCRGPMNPLLLMRTRGLHGPTYQPVAPGQCAKSMGNFYADGAPGDIPPAYLCCDFSQSTLEPRGTGPSLAAAFSRAGTAYQLNPDGSVTEVAANVPRFVQSASGAMGYLNEPAATNQALGSDDFDNAETYWAGVAVGWIVYNEMPSMFPNGTAWQGVEKISGSRSRSQNVTARIAANTKYVCSFYFEYFHQADTRLFSVGINDTGTGGTGFDATGRLEFDPTTESSVWGIVPTNPDAWFHFAKIGTGPSGGRLGRIDLHFDSTHFGGTTQTISIYPMGTRAPFDGGTTIIHGVQLEEAPGPTSFIRTTSAAASRAGDLLHYTGVDINADYTVQVDVTSLVDSDGIINASQRHFASRDAAASQIRTALGNLDVWNSSPLGTNGILHQLAYNVVQKQDLRSGFIFAASQEGADVKARIFYGGEDKDDSTIAGRTLSHSSLNQMNVGGQYNGQQFPGIYHGFAMWPQRLDDQKISLISRPGWKCPYV